MQYDFGIIDPQVRDGTWLANALNQWRDALYGKMWGPTPPTFAVDGFSFMAAGNTTAPAWWRHRWNNTWFDVVYFDTVTGKVEFANTVKKDGDTITGAITMQAPIYMNGTLGAFLGGDKPVAQGGKDSKIWYDATTDVWSWSINGAATFQLFPTGAVSWLPMTGSRLYADSQYASANVISRAADGSAEMNLQAGTGGKAAKLESVHAAGVNYFNLFRATADTMAWEFELMRIDMANGTVRFAGDVTAFSDARDKTNVNTITGALMYINALRGVRYERISTGEKGVGVIAQEVESYFPEVVKIGDNGIRSVAYGNLVGPLIEAIKELSQKVNSLERELDAIRQGGAGR